MIPRIPLLYYLLLVIPVPQVHSQMIQNPAGTSHPVWTSVLSTGKWYKIKIFHDGIYKLTYDDIKGMGFSDPSGIRIFGNGGAMLPLMNADPRYDDLLENTIYMFKGSDSEFNQGDYVLFYGKGPVTWTYNDASGMFEHQVNQYTNAAYYFATTDAGIGKKITPAPEVTGAIDVTTNTFNDYDFHEKNKYNFLKSGRQWFGERIDYSSYDTIFNFAGLVTSAPVKLKVNVLSRSATSKSFILQYSGQILGLIAVPGVILSNSTGIYANQKSGLFSFNVTGDQVDVSLSYNKSESSDEGFLDYITVNVRRNLALSGDALFFRD